MKATLLFSLCALLCSLASCATLHPPTPTDFNVTQVSGKWYLVGLATNRPWLATYKDYFKDITTTVLPTAAGDVNVTYSLLGHNGACQRFTHAIQHTETPGRFTFHGHHKNTTYCESVVEVVYDSYLLLHTIQTQPANSSYSLSELHSRTPEVSAALEDKFEQFAMGAGVQSDNIFFLPTNGTFCC